MFTAKHFSSWAQSLTAQSSSCLKQHSERTTLVLFLKMTLLAFTILEKALQTVTKNNTKTVLLQNVSLKRDKRPPKQKGMLILNFTNDHFNDRDVLVIVVPSCSLLQGLHARAVTLRMCIHGMRDGSSTGLRAQPSAQLPPGRAPVPPTGTSSPCRSRRTWHRGGCPAATRARRCSSPTCCSVRASEPAGRASAPSPHGRALAEQPGLPPAPTPHT